MALSYEEQLVITILVVLACSIAATSERIPYHVSILSGQAWMLELLDGHPARIHNALGLHRKTFLELVETLRSMGYTDSRHITLEEQLGIFLYTCRTGLTSEHVAERFQHSKKTISLYEFSWFSTCFSCI